MKNVRINDFLIYQEYDSDIQMFEALDIYLNRGYRIVRHIYLCPVLKLDAEEYILSYLKIENPNQNIEEQILSLKEEHELFEPDYSDTILNVLAGIRENYGFLSSYKKNPKVFDKKYKNCIVMLLDGLGVNILEKNLDESSFLRKHMLYSEHAIYPSTTAASTTTTICGLTPLESGWTGWENYIPELKKSIILFTGVDYFSEEPTGRTGYDFMPYDTFYSDMPQNGQCILPDFSQKVLKIDDVLKKSLKLLDPTKENIQYVYFTEPDGLMHANGPYADEVKEILKEIDRKVERYAKQLPEDTLLIISADHGHTAVEELNLYACKSLYKYLETKPSNDARCIVFRVKEGMEKEFVSLFQSLFGDVYQLFPTKEYIKKGFFGNPNGKIHERIPVLLGNYIAIATNKYYFNYKGKDDFSFKSHHAGITREEMEVPVLVVRR